MQNLYKLISLIGSDNNMPAMPFEKMPKPDAVKGFDVVALDTLAENLSESETIIMAVGESTEIEELIEEKGLHTLNEFLNDAFDGDLNDLFYVQP